jgi:hypothetical protein
MLSSLSRGLLLANVRARLVLALVAIGALWAVVLWASVEPPPVEEKRAAAPPAPVLRAVVATGQAAPGGGSFDRFDVNTQPVIAPVNAKGHVAFYATLIRSKATEGIFLAKGAEIVRVAAVGDPVPGGGRLSEFAKHPVPSLNDAGKVAFVAAVAGARASEGVFLFDGGKLTAIALSGAEAPQVFSGTFAEFDVPVLNNRDEIVFAATVRKGRETVQAIYLYSNGRVRKLHASGDVVLPRGTLDKFGVPAMNNKGLVVLPATVERGTVLGGLFVTGNRTLSLVVGAGDANPGGGILVRFSERIGVDDDDNIAFGAHLSTGAGAEAVLRVNADGLATIAKVGDEAPGGGRFAAFGAWPTVGAPDTIAFVGALEGTSKPVGIFVARGTSIERVVAPGDALSGSGATLPSLALNPIASLGSNGGLTFATLADPASGLAGIFYYGPPAQP